MIQSFEEAVIEATNGKKIGVMVLHYAHARHLHHVVRDKSEFGPLISSINPNNLTIYFGHGVLSFVFGEAHFRGKIFDAVHIEDIPVDLPWGLVRAFQSRVNGRIDGS